MRTNIGVFKINLQYNLKVPDLSHLGTLPNFGFKSHHPAFWVSTVELEGRRHDDLVAHGQTDDQTDQEGESSGRLRHGPHIGHGVDVPGGGEHTEVQGGGREAGPDAHVEETQEHEECHILQVIQVASPDPLHIRVVQDRFDFWAPCILVIGEHLVLEPGVDCDEHDQKHFQYHQSGVADKHPEHGVIHRQTGGHIGVLM